MCSSMSVRIFDGQSDLGFTPQVIQTLTPRSGGGEGPEMDLGLEARFARKLAGYRRDRGRRDIKEPEPTTTRTSS